jgi:hypothetical protein
VNALASAEVGKYLNEHFVSSFQKVGTFRIAGGQKQGGNVSAYFCAPDGRVLHVVAGPVTADVLLHEAKWVVESTKNAIDLSHGDGARFKALLRQLHAERLRRERGLVVQAVTFDPTESADEPSALTYRDPTGRPLAPTLPPAPLEGPDVSFHGKVALAGAVAQPVRDRTGRPWALDNQGRVHMLLAAHALVPIEKLYGSVFENILGEKVSTRPVEIADPFPWVANRKSSR